MLNLNEICKSRAKGFVTDPKKLVRYVVLLICCVVVIFQLSECFTKLYRPPITTHSHFDLNETVSYPAITFCRDPPYKEDVLRAHNLSYHPKFSNAWRNFDFRSVDLKELFENATYGKTEFFGQYGLDGTPENVDIVSGIYFNYGQCHTMSPKVMTRRSWKNHGYSLILTHTLDASDETNSENDPGWHVFIHEPKENFTVNMRMRVVCDNFGSACSVYNRFVECGMNWTETNMETSGRVEYMYIKSGEEVEIKLTATHFNMKSGRDRSCTDDINHSAIRCADICQWSKITDPIGCSGPWMPGVDLPYCNNFTDMRTLLSNYQTLADINISECGCSNPCKSVIYSAYVMNRGNFEKQAVPSSQVWLYYTSKMVTVFEERPNYDLTQFVADMGGSLGFLLGLSVLGLIKILEKIVSLIFGNYIRKHQEKAEQAKLDEKQSTNKDNDLCSSTTTLELPSDKLSQGDSGGMNIEENSHA